jgi:hypothetical protein
VFAHLRLDGERRPGSRVVGSHLAAELVASLDAADALDLVIGAVLQLSYAVFAEPKMR